MGYTLYSKEYKEFFDQIKGGNLTPDELVVRINSAVRPLAKELHIGKAELFLDSPVSAYEEDGFNRHVTLYEAEDGYSEPCVSMDFVTSIQGKCEGRAYPVQGHIFTEDECEAMRYLMELLYIVFGRGRLMTLMQKATFTDSLSGIMNTSGLHATAGQYMARGILNKYDGVFMNLKNFKYVNKMVSSRQGDVVLRLYAQALRSFVEEDEVCARLGGDNFFLLVKKERIQDLIKFAEDIPIAIEFGGAPKVFHITSRMGIYDIQERDHMGEVMNNASIAIGVAKTSVVDDVIWFCPEMAERAVRQKMISSLFPQALKNREFVVYYQPKVTLENDELCACEALVRWIRNGNLIPPMEFVPVLENEGSVCDLDFYVFEQVCMDLRAWLDAGIEPVCVSVNFSKIHLHDENLAASIFDIMNKYQIDSKYIEVELTEMSGYENYEALSNFVMKIKEAGIKTSIDDFGSGYSSLNMLKDLNADIIKLDKTFLDHLRKEDSKQDEIVIKNIVNMINELDMEAIAEGVETKEQADFLREVKCKMAQGFLYDRPLPHDEFEQRLVSGRSYQI